MVTPQLKLKLKFRVTSETLKQLVFILYFCNPFIRLFFSALLSKFGMSEYAYLATIVLIYSLVLFLIVLDRRNFIKDFAVLFLFIIAFFAITLLIHPNYEYWYKRSTYGVWDYVLRPDNGLYAYFFIRLLNNPENIMKTLKKCAWIMYPYYMYLLLNASRVGYWIDHNSSGQLIHYKYSLTFGYDVLLYVLVFLYAAFEKKKVIDIILSIAGIFMILKGGSRGPLLCIAIFVIILIAKSFQESRSSKKMGMLLATIGLAVILFVSYDKILSALINLLNQFNVSSRTLTMLLEGSIADNNGRYEIWNAAIEMIKKNPFGYGAMGTRHVIYYYHYVGHCHQIFLEMLVDYGVFLGTALIILMLAKAFQILFSKGTEKWFGVFMIFFCRSCHLLMSGTYWHLLSFWACIGIGVSIYYEKKTCKRRRKINGRF
ncbi:MAG: O-antigen ligase family protein [Eubacteriales bacterium]|nr:O-antigen ligase family protein [Eubacteriales bacterium]